MKLFMFFSFLFLLSGCGKINDLIASKNTDNNQSEEIIYDNQEEVKLLVPWDLFI